MGAFAEACGANGITLVPIEPKAPWQNGRKLPNAQGMNNNDNSNMLSAKESHVGIRIRDTWPLVLRSSELLQQPFRLLQCNGYYVTQLDCQTHSFRTMASTQSIRVTIPQQTSKDRKLYVKLPRARGPRRIAGQRFSGPYVNAIDLQLRLQTDKSFTYGCRGKSATADGTDLES